MKNIRLAALSLAVLMSSGQEASAFGFGDMFAEAKKQASKYAAQNMAKIAQKAQSKAESAAYGAMGKGNLVAFSKEAEDFLASLAFMRWDQQQKQGSFTSKLSTSHDLWKEIEGALDNWVDALMSQGISPSGDSMQAKIRSAGCDVLVNELNNTVIGVKGNTAGQYTMYLKKGPWGFLPCSPDGSQVIDVTGQVVPTDQINETMGKRITTGQQQLTSYILVDNGNNTFKLAPIDATNFEVLLKSNLDPFLPQPGADGSPAHG